MTREELEQKWGWKISECEIYDEPKIFTDTASSGKKITTTIIGKCIMGCQICGRMSEHEMHEIDCMKCLGCGVTKYIYKGKEK